MMPGGRLGSAAPRFSPLVGAGVGAVGGVVYWSAALIWPASVAAALALLVMAWVDPTPNGEEAAVRAPGGVLILTVLLKYTALMALSAAKLPYAVPPNVALGIILISAHAASRALAVSALAAPPQSTAPGVSASDLSIALVLGFTPAVLLGIPGLVGLGVALAARMVFGAYIKRRRAQPTACGADTPSGPAGPAGPAARAGGSMREAAEIAFYLGALAAWSYI